MNPTWFRLLDEQRNGTGITPFGRAAGGRIGLTPAFLVGAVRVPVGSVADEATSLAELKALLMSMRDHASDATVRIVECGNLRQPVASLDGTIVGLDSVSPPDGSASSLYGSPEYFGQASRDVESLASGLWSILGPPICEGQFSFREGRFQEFSREDLDFIQHALGRDPEDEA